MAIEHLRPIVDDAEPYAPHETRMLALEVAVEYVNGDTKRGNFYTADDVVASARKFEAYLTEKPIAGFEAADPVAA